MPAFNLLAFLTDVKKESNALLSKNLVGRVRLERTTNWLKANCSTD